MDLDAIFSFFSVGEQVVEIESNAQWVHNSINKYNAGCIRFRESELVRPVCRQAGSRP